MALSAPFNSAIRKWHRSKLGVRISLRLQQLSHTWHQSLLEAQLKSCGSGAFIARPVTFMGAENISLGIDVNINAFVHIWGFGGVTIGDRTMIASHVALTTITHDYNVLNMRDTIVKKPITIGSDVWIGSHAVIMPGITIGNGAVIGAGAVVTKDVAAGDIVVGIPARVVAVRPAEILQQNLVPVSPQ